MNRKLSFACEVIFCTSTALINTFKKPPTFSQIPALSVGGTCYLASPDFVTITSLLGGSVSSTIQWENNKPAFRLLWRSDERAMCIFQSAIGTLVIISTIDQSIFACRSGQSISACVLQTWDEMAGGVPIGGEDRPVSYPVSSFQSEACLPQGSGLLWPELWATL